MYIKRHMEAHIKKLEKMYGAILITGPRRIGKTTILENIRPDLNLLNFDNMVLREEIKNAPNAFFKDHEFPLILDEVQRVPELFLQLKYELDKTKKKALCYMTGSQSFRLMKNISESLAGRMGIVTLLGLSQREKYNIDLIDSFVPTDEYISRRNNIKIDYKDIWNEIIRGGYPELFVDGNFERNIFFSDYISTYIERDVRDLTQVADVIKFSKFMQYIAAQVGSLLNLSSISKELSISVPTCEKYLSVLVSSHIVYLLKPYENNLSKRLVKTPKVYFHDTGLVCHLLKWNAVDTLKNGAMAGHIFENYVISEIIKGYHNEGYSDPPIYFYRDKDKKEIDLIIEKDGTIYPVEIKMHSDPTNRDVSAFSLLSKFTNTTIGQGGLITFYEDPITISPNVRNIPVSYL